MASRIDSLVDLSFWEPNYIRRLRLRCRQILDRLRWVASLLERMVPAGGPGFALFETWDSVGTGDRRLTTVTARWAVARWPRPATFHLVSGKHAGCGATR